MKDQQKRIDNPQKYRWIAYFQYGWHAITYLTDEEAEQAIKLYRLYRDGRKWVRIGREPITIMPR